MNKYSSYIFSFFTLILLFIPFFTQAQVNKNAKQKADSIREARIRQTDSIRTARQATLDSIREVRQKELNLLRAQQKHRSDSLKKIQDYRKSKRYRDSIAQVRQARTDSTLAARRQVIDSIKLVRQQYNDSVLAERKRFTDSMKLARQEYNDSLRAHNEKIRAERAKELAIIKAERQHRLDSLAAIRAYRNSKQYKDSVATVRQNFRDSLIAARKHYTDSIRAEQKFKTDSMIAMRKAENERLRASIDSMRAERQKVIDSLTTVRKARADSLAAVRAEREAQLEEKEKEKKLALEFEMEKERENYSNKQMLRKRWSLLRRVAQNTFTRYNYYYNTNLKMEEAKANMLRSNEDNYEQLLKLFPYDPDIDSAKMASDMDTIIKKGALGIQIHDPRSKWQDDLFLLVGQAYYYKGDYENAGAAFRQIIVMNEKKKKGKKKNKKNKDNKQEGYSIAQKGGIIGKLKHNPATNDAMLWLARTLAKMNEEGQAQTLLDMLKNDVNFPKKMQGKLALEQAHIDLNNDNHTGAINTLGIVAYDKNIPKWQRQRAAFIAAQLFQDERQNDSANYYFKKVIALHPPNQMDFYARKNIAFNQLFNATDDRSSIELLEKLAKDGKYKSFYDQVYYGIALAEETNGNQDAALANYRKSLEFGKNNPKQSGLSYAKMGDIHYDKENYLTAKFVYDSATALLGEHQHLPEYQRALLRGHSLSEIVTPANTVSYADSLLRLSSLSEAEQRDFIRNYIKQLERVMKDSAFLAENLKAGPQGAGLAMGNASAQSWYFSNPTRISKGEATFKQVWGSRKPTDNWRISSKSQGGAAFASGDNDGDENDDSDGFQLPDEDELYAAIPHSEEEVNELKDSLHHALYQLGKGYYIHLEDYSNALKTFDTLEKKFPYSSHIDEILYIRFLIATRQNETLESEKVFNRLAKDYPESKWYHILLEAQKVEATGEEGELAADNTIDGYYDNTYNLLQDKQYSLVLERSRNYVNIFTVPGEYAPKFKILEAASLIGSGDYLLADTLLNKFIEQNPKKDLLDWANHLLSLIKQIQHPEDTLKVQDKDEDADVQKKLNEAFSLEFIYNADEAHYIIMIANADMRIFAVRSAMRDFFMMHPDGKGITIAMTTLNPENNLIACQTFENKIAASALLRDLKIERTIFKEYKNKEEYQLLIISQTNYVKMMQEKNLKNYLDFYKKHYQ